MTCWVFSGTHVDDYIDPDPAAFKKGTFMYHTHMENWFRCSPYKGPAPRKHDWCAVDDEEVPKIYRAKLLLLE
jgi:hypothetical protein